ncbi:MAG: septal ring lytic transglycosylase RlpA family protein [Saprospiraceae bacterium]|nr:septal ring lytic transglycosylase RlpA family protein [Saprospiraceae bacterium]
MRKLAIVVLLLICATSTYAQDLGLASVYSPKFQKKFTANGESFSHSEFTASHRQLPFGTLVKVTRIDNGKSVVVRIIDRGPFVNGYITNLSKTAALKIGMLGENTEAKVKIEVYSEPKAQASVINTRPRPRLDQPNSGETLEVTAKSVPGNIPSEYRMVTPSTPSPNNRPTRIAPNFVQKKKVRL